jgi:hypothetical protein
MLEMVVAAQATLSVLPADVGSVESIGRNDRTW